MTVWLYRGSLSALSGAGRLMLAQARALAEAGVHAHVAGERGALRFWLRSGQRARRVHGADLEALARDAGDVVVDHGGVLGRPAIAFVHNVYSEAVRHLDREDWRARAATEAEHFARLDEAVPIVANSNAVARALEARFSIAPGRVSVIHPGFDAVRFDPRRLPALRAAARRQLGLDGDTRLVGFVTSGDFAKRGLDTFLETAERIVSESARVRFLVVGSKRLPESAAAHALFASGHALYRPRSAGPELWLAALDVFLYAACYEEFGLVVSEAAALGVPVVTSRRVGATECLPEAYAPWIADAPDVDELAARVNALVDDAGERERLASAGAQHVRRCSDAEYGRRSAAVILACDARRKGGGLAGG